MSLHRNNRRLTKIFRPAGNVQILIRGGRQVFPNQFRYRLPGLDFRTVKDADGLWFEAGFRAPEMLTGNGTDGWEDGRGFVHLEFETSVDLVTWEAENAEDCAVTEIAAGGGDYDYWVRGLVPVYWQSTLRDFRAASNRYGKSITAIRLYDADISLPNFPYAMPADKAILQTDLRAAGYTGATVTSTTAALDVGVINHMVGGRQPLPVTMVGTDVTGVSREGSTIGLAGYPYSMPSQKTALQADLRAAGYDGTVVKLFADPWEIFIPDKSISGPTFPFYPTISPGDPFKFWDFEGNYMGENPDTVVLGSAENTRDPSGNPLREAAKQFFRLKSTTLR